MMKRYLPLLYIFVLVAVLIFAALNQIEPEEQQVYVPAGPLSLPQNYQQNFVRYMQVDRPDDTVRFLYVRPDVLNDLQPGQFFPFGTQLLIETYHAQTDARGALLRDENGHFVAGEMFPNIHVMEKRDNWTLEELPSPIGVIDWNFGSFVAATGLASDENRNDCLTCHHNGAFSRDLAFSRRVIDRFIVSGEVQYLYCNRINRGNCIP